MMGCRLEEKESRRVVRGMAFMDSEDGIGKKGYEREVVMGLMRCYRDN